MISLTVQTYNEFEETLEEKLQHLKLEDRNKMKKYMHLFSLSGVQNLGCTSKVTHHINTGNYPPINKRPYLVPQVQIEVL